MAAKRARTAEERAYYALSARVYRLLAPFYDLTVRPLRALRREVAAAVPLGPRTRALDVATGTGAQAAAFAEKGGEVVGIDLSEAMLRVARRKHGLRNLTFRHADATDLPFEDRSFDASSISFALHEMPRTVRERVLAELVRVTKPGGAIVVVDYGLPRNAIARAIVFRLVKLYERDAYVDFIRSDVRALLERTGIEVEEARPALHGVVCMYRGHKREARDWAGATVGADRRLSG